MIKSRVCVYLLATYHLGLYSIVDALFVPHAAASVRKTRIRIDKRHPSYGTCRRRYPITTTNFMSSNLDDDDSCLIGENVVDQCSQIATLGTESQRSAATNLAKCICGAGSFALPHVFLEEGVLGGIVALTVCGALATSTMQSLSDSTIQANNNKSVRDEPITSYVQLARAALGEPASKIVFALTLSASLGVCSTYLVFIGSTLESMSCDVESNIVRLLAPDISEFQFEIAAALLLYPLSLIRDYSIFAFTSALGVFAVVGGIVVTLAYGILVDPGGGFAVAIDSIETLPMWPASLSQAFGGSFGTICYLFAINFLTFPVINSMKNVNEYNGAVSKAVSGVWIVNVIFSILALGFYREDTQDLVLANLDNGPYLSALKLLLCVDLLFTFPIILSSGRQILENALLGPDSRKEESFSLARAGIVAGAVSSCFGLAQIGGFGAVANLVGGVAQGTLAFIMPPAIAVAIAKQAQDDDEEMMMMNGGEMIGQYAIAAFGVSVVAAVTYFTFSDMQ